MDGSTGRAGIIEAGVSPGSIAGLGAMSVADVFRRTTMQENVDYLPSYQSARRSGVVIVKSP